MINCVLGVFLEVFLDGFWTFFWNFFWKFFLEVFLEVFFGSFFCQFFPTLFSTVFFDRFFFVWQFWYSPDRKVDSSCSKGIIRSDDSRQQTTICPIIFLFCRWPGSPWMGSGNTVIMHACRPLPNYHSIPFCDSRVENNNLFREKKIVVWTAKNSQKTV